MSREHAKKFFDQVNRDASLRARIRNASTSAAEEIVKIGKEHGHEFTHAELRNVLTEAWGSGQLKASPGDDDPSTCFYVSERPGK